MSIPALSDIVRNGVSAFTAGGGGSATITRHEIDFGAVARDAATFDVTVSGISLEQSVIACVSLNMPLGVDQDELEMDPITLAAHSIAADTVRVIATSRHPVRGKRAINIMR